MRGTSRKENGNQQQALKREKDNQAIVFHLIL